MKADVIGAAITGPSAAIRLAKMGYTVTVHDQRGEDDLYSAGILGISHGVWNMLQHNGVHMNRHELPGNFQDVNSGQSVTSPFRFMAWTDLHGTLVRQARACGVRFTWNDRVTDFGNPDTLTVDATGVAGAARKRLGHTYSGVTIFRGLSALNTDDGFDVYRWAHGQYFTTGHTPYGAFWTMVLPRPVPEHLTTTDTTTPPAEYRTLPARFRRMVEATPAIAVTPVSDWEVPEHVYTEDGRYYSVGDVNGAISPVTTAGANLGVIEGMSIGRLIDPATRAATEADLLARRAYDLKLAADLDAPEIGGTVEDKLYPLHHAILFPGRLA